MNRVAKALGYLGIISFLGIVPIVNAASTCDYETQIKLRKEANSINVNYESGWHGTGEYESLEVPDEDGNTEYEIVNPGIKNYIYNITENLYVVVRNTKTDETKTFTFQNSDNGTVSWNTDATEIRNYEIKIYSNHEDCKDEEYNKISLITPKYNNHNAHSYCNNNQEYYCEEFIAQELNMTDDQVYQKAIEDEIKRNEENNKENKENEESFFHKYGIYLGIIATIILIGVLGTVILRQVKRSKTI